MATISLSIDDKQVTGDKGMTVLQVARRNGIYIPHLCDYEGLTPFSGCRVCLVEIEGRRGLDTSCTIMASEGMVVRTNTPHIKDMQRGVMEALLSEHPDRCLTCPREDRCPPEIVCQRDNIVTDRCVLCPRNKQCELQRVVDFVGIRWNRLGEGRRPPKPERSNPFVERNESYCIYCARCVRACDEMRGIFAFGLAYRGPHTRISVDFDKELKDSPCNFCGECAIVCPTGALIKRDSVYGRIPDENAQSVCSLCSDGCSLYLNLRDGRIVNVLPDIHAPHNAGQLCVRGQFAYDYVYHKDRLTTPLIRGDDGQLHPASWDEALDAVASGLLATHRRRGPDAIGFIGSAHLGNEDAYCLQKFARAILGTNNVDLGGNSSLAPSVAALHASFGVAAATNPTADLALSGCLLVVGSATVESHEITALRIKKAVRNGAKLIVVDPRRTSLERFAYLYLQPRPGTDLVLLRAMLKVIVDEKRYDDANFASQDRAKLASALEAYDPEQTATLTGVAASDVIAAARIFASGGTDDRYQMPASWLGTLVDPGSQPASRAASIVYGSGATSQPDGQAVVETLIDLSLITGNIGKPGGGVYPRLGEHNTQGALDVGLWPDLLPGQRPVSDPVARLWLAEHWGAEPPAKVGLSMLEMLEAAGRGALNALYLVGVDPLRIAPEPARVRHFLSKLDLLVVQGLFPSQITELAHVVLPAASYAEKASSYTNDERRVQWAAPAIAPIGESRPDWQIVSALASRAGRLLGVSGPKFDQIDAAAVMTEIAQVVPAYRGVTHVRLRDGGIQWPCPDAQHPGTPILFADPADRARLRLTTVDLVAPGAASPAQSPDARYPLLLITGCEIYHAGTGALTHRAKATAKFRPEARVECHPDDVAALRLTRGDVARIVSHYGSVQAKVEPNDSLPPGTAFLSVHYPDCPVNTLFTWPDPAGLHLPQPKSIAVRIDPA